MNGDMNKVKNNNPYMYCSENMPMQQYNQTQLSAQGQMSPLQFPVTSSTMSSPSTPLMSGAMPSTPSTSQTTMDTTVDIVSPQSEGIGITQQGPPPLANVEYIPGFLARHIGRYVKAEFIVGTNQFVDKTGRLVAVGVNYFVLQDVVSRNNIMCDLYSVRFVTMM